MHNRTGAKYDTSTDIMNAGQLSGVQFMMPRSGRVVTRF